MINVLLFFIIILCLIAIYEFSCIKIKNKNLFYINNKLRNNLKKNSTEKILLTTDDKYLISLLSTINKFIDNNQKIVANHINSRESMKKMLSNISHDIKTPLTVISGYIELLINSNNLDEEEKLKYLNHIQIKSFELSELINQFFSLTKLESGDIDIPLERVNASEICKKLILSFYEILTTKGFEVEINILDEDIYIWANEFALDRILNNLISNVVKYGYEGKFLGLTLKNTDDFIYIEVSDKGRGISEKNFERVFERLYTLEDSRNKEFQGSGLGLTITKNLIEKINGEITLTSIPYKKTTFSVKLKKLKF